MGQGSPKERINGSMGDIAGTPASKPTGVMKSKGKTKAIANTMK